MAKRNPSALRGVSAKMLSYRLSGMGLKYKHTNHGNYYLVHFSSLHDSRNGTSTG
jgi:hypothetical protein